MEKHCRGMRPLARALLDTRKLAAGVISATAVGAVAAPPALAHWGLTSFWDGNVPPAHYEYGVQDVKSLSQVWAAQYDRVGCADIQRSPSYYNYYNCHQPGTVDHVSFPPPEYRYKWAFCYNQGTVYSNVMVCQDEGSGIGA